MYTRIALNSNRIKVHSENRDKKYYIVINEMSETKANNHNNNSYNNKCYNKKMWNEIEAKEGATHILWEQN